MGRCRLGVWTGSVGWSVGRCVLPKEGGGGGDQTRKWLHAGHAFVMGSSTEGVLGVLAPLQSSIGQPRHIVMESWDRQNCIGLSGHIVVGRGVAAGGVVVVASGATPSGPAAGTCPAAAASSAPPFGKARGKGKLGLPMAEVFAQWQSAPPALRHPFRECFAPGWPKWDEGGGGCCMSVCVCVREASSVPHARFVWAIVWVSWCVQGSEAEGTFRLVDSEVCACQSCCGAFLSSGEVCREWCYINKAYWTHWHETAGGLGTSGLGDLVAIVVCALVYGGCVFGCMLLSCCSWQVCGW